MKYLIVVDMQNDFIDGALGTPEAVAILPNVKSKINSYIENGDKIVYTRDTHYENYLETQEGQNLPVVHCVEYTDGWQINSEVYDYRGRIFDKPTFGLDDWMHQLTYNDIIDVNELESIEIIGLCTDICVISNAMILKAQFYETPIYVDSACCAGVTPESHKNALEAMKMCQINVI